MKRCWFRHRECQCCQYCPNSCQLWLLLSIFWYLCHILCQFSQVTGVFWLHFVTVLNHHSYFCIFTRIKCCKFKFRQIANLTLWADIHASRQRGCCWCNSWGRHVPWRNRTTSYANDILGHFPARLVGTEAVKEKHDVFQTPVAKPHWTLKLRPVTEKKSLLQAFIHRITAAKTALAMWLVLAK